MPMRGKLDAVAQHGSSVTLGSRAELLQFGKGIVRRKIFGWETNQGLGLTRHYDRERASAGDTEQSLYEHSPIHSQIPPLFIDERWNSNGEVKQEFQAHVH